MTVKLPSAIQYKRNCTVPTLSANNSEKDSSQLLRGRSLNSETKLFRIEVEDTQRIKDIVVI